MPKRSGQNSIAEESVIEQFTIFSFRSGFFDIFGNSCSSHAIAVEDARKKTQVQYLYRYLQEIGCVSIIRENEYVDRDFLDDYAAYYAKCFVPYGRFCRRAHFFSNDISELDLTDLIVEARSADIDLINQSYLGFTVIKPLPEAIIGRTVLKTYGDDQGKRKFRAVVDYNANLFGLQLKVEDSLAFQEQDTVLAACATTALWCAFQVTSERFHLTSPTPHEITKSATKYVQTSRAIPTHGLILEQICTAISEHGLAPEVVIVNSNTPVNSLIHSYVSAKLPVVLGYRMGNTENRHAVTVCGYRLEDSPCNDVETNCDLLEMNLIGRRISEFYVHDDNLGPFSRLNSSTSRGANVEDYDNPRLYLRSIDDRTEPVSCVPEMIIVPLYHKIRLCFGDVWGSLRYVSKYFNALDINQVDKHNPEGIEWEIRLITVGELKQKLLHLKSISTDVREKLLFANLPRFMWVASAMLYRQRIFSLLADATNIERSFHFQHFVSHIPNLKENIASIITESDADLSKASQAGLPSTFASFVEKSILS